MELLDEPGDERAITLRSVARRVGIADPSIYPHFHDQPAIMLAVVRQEFAGLGNGLRARSRGGGRRRPAATAVRRAYLEFARLHPERYRTTFGGLGIPDLTSSSLTERDRATLGAESMQILIDALADCARAGSVTSTDVPTDAVALQGIRSHGVRSLS
ncbi:hypothetical protein B046DRAFT_01415 [Streptomyces sp. LamerLS-316]|uniref:TetR-like C-terminal domain-containing protein n=1 Tax=unclassified Streptomyces TaxID=2593676 RepID=UPI000823D9F1|nr:MULTISPECIES: TetR-like C-terminal domain-containing protein [unclassified Streptomyces]SCK15007.1 hypothetical protein B046DRAFT_01415 [Streptomyces sp. LamerLS-316]